MNYKALEEAFKKLESDYKEVVKDSVEKDRRVDELLAVASDTEAKYRFTESRLSNALEKNKFHQKEKVKLEKENVAISQKLEISEDKLEQLHNAYLLVEKDKSKLKKEYKAI